MNRECGFVSEESYCIFKDKDAIILNNTNQSTCDIYFLQIERSVISIRRVPDDI